MIVKTRSASPATYPGITVTGYISNTTGCNMQDCIDLYRNNPPSVRNITGGANAAEITYELGKDKFNYCLHEFDKLEVNWDLSRTPYACCWKDGQWYYTSSWAGVYTPQLPAVPEVFEVTGEMRRRAWASLFPEINNGLSLATTIVEFKDITRLWKTALKTKRYLTKLVKLSKNRVSSGKTLSDLILSHQFGVMPIVRDIQGIVEDLLDLKKTCNQFKNEGLRVQSYHYTETLADEEEWETQGHCNVKVQVKADYFATLKCSYDYKVPEFWDALFRVGGLRITPAVVWDLIPFSFVIDWLINIQKFIEQFDKDPRVTVYVHDYCDTVKSVTQKSAHRIAGESDPNAYVPSDPFPGMALQGTLHPYQEGRSSDPLWTWKRVRYERQPGEPDTGYALPESDIGLSGRQLVLGGALLRARYR